MPTSHRTSQKNRWQERIEAFNPGLEEFFLRFTGSHIAAHDLAVQVWRGLKRDAHQIHPRVPLLHYLYRRGVRAMDDYLERMLGGIQRVGEERCEGREHQEFFRLALALMKLHESIRWAVYMRYFSALSVTQQCAILGLSEPELERLLERARTAHRLSHRALSKICVRTRLHKLATHKLRVDVEEFPRHSRQVIRPYQHPSPVFFQVAWLTRVTAGLVALFGFVILIGV